LFWVILDVALECNTMLFHLPIRFIIQILVNFQKSFIISCFLFWV
jgi:hypothetical protein